MSNIVLMKSNAEMLKMQEFYQSNLTNKVPSGGLFSAKTANCAITAYKSGKVLFQGSGSSNEAKRWGGAEATKTAATKPAKPNKNVHLPTNIGKLSIIGSDEVGTGDYFGPITVVAAYVRKEELSLLQELGVKDSKDLNDEKISEIAKQLVQFLPHSLLVLHNEKYNQLQKSGMSQGKIKAFLHNQAIGHLLKKISPEKPEAILIDQFAKEGIYFNYLKGQSNVQKENVYFSTKAESIHLAVAAASIIARYAFIKHFDKLSTAAGFKIPKGAGSKVDLAAARLIKEKGRDALPEFVKLHFANTEKALNLIKRK